MMIISTLRFLNIIQLYKESGTIRYTPAAPDFLWVIRGVSFSCRFVRTNPAISD